MNSKLAIRTASMAALAVASADNSVSVCRDATYNLPSSRGPICSGAGSAPAGSACPLVGDVASGDCYAYLPSYEGSQCTAKESAVCTIVNGDTWGCVFPSVGCGDSGATPCPVTALPDTNMTGKAPGWPFATGEVDNSQDMKMPNASDYTQGKDMPTEDMIGAGTTQNPDPTLMNPTDVSQGAEVTPINPTDVSQGAEVTLMNPSNATDVPENAGTGPTAGEPTEVTQSAEMGSMNPNDGHQDSEANVGAAPDAAQAEPLKMSDPATGGTGPAIPPPSNTVEGNTMGTTSGTANPTEGDETVVPPLVNVEENVEGASTPASGTTGGNLQNVAPVPVTAPATQ